MIRLGRTLSATAVALALAGGGLLSGPTGPASASTVNAVATLATPGTSSYLASGGSATPFTVSLPPNAACDGDTASDGYHVFSYLVPKGTDLSSVTFGEAGPSVGYGIVEANGVYYGSVNTAIGTGEIVQIPNDFEWAPLVTQDGLLSSLLGTTGGVWETGLACATTTGALADNWNTEITFTASSSDPNGFAWSAVPGPSGSAVAAITSADHAAFGQGTLDTFTVTATGSPTPVLGESGTLPTGVTFDAATGVLSGTPTTGGSFPITFTATNGIGDPAVQPFTLSVGGPATFTSADHTSFVDGAPGSFTVTATGTPAPTLAESGTLPTGVTFDAGTGVLSGTATTAGVFPLTFTATNGVGSPAVQHFTLTIGAPPAFTSATGTTFTVGTSGSFTVAASGFPAPTFSVTTGTLPTGVTLNATSGVLSGDPTQGGSFALTLTASNGVGSPATQGFSLVVDEAPAITSADHATFPTGAQGSFTVTASGYPAPTFTVTSGTLPTGVTLNATTGILSGTTADSGTFPVTLSAANGIGSPATQPFTLNVGGAPAFTSPDTTTFTEGSAGTFTVTASGSPAPTFSVTSGSLPTGVSLDAGVLSGTPTVSGSFPVTLRATNGVAPDATQHFTLDVDGPPAITSADSATFSVDAAGRFTVTATGFPAPTFTEGGPLPAGVTLDATSGVLSGTATQSGTFPVTLTASNGVGTPATQDFTLSVVAGPVFTSADSTTFTEGTAGSFTVTANGAPAPTFAVSSGTLPTGVSLAASGVLSGTASQSGVFAVVITAQNGNGPAAQQDFTLTVDGAPAITSAARTSFVVGLPGSFTVSTSGYPSPTFAESGTLPAGITLDAATGVLSGTADQSGSFPLSLTATNGIGSPATQQFTLAVDGPPAITSAFDANFVAGTAGSFTVTATGYPAPAFALTAGTLPTGITFNATTGVLSGSPTQSGAYPVTVTASNGVDPAASQDLAVNVTAPPSITSADSTTFVTGQADVFTITTGGFPVPTLAVTSGTLPAGVTLDPTGVLAGTATEAGVSIVTLTASNGVGDPASQTFVLDAIPAPLAVTACSLPAATAGVSYGQSDLAAGGGVAPYTWTVSGGVLPSGLTLDAATGQITGIPTAGSSASLTLTVTDSANPPDTASVTATLTVNPAKTYPSTLAAPVVGLAAPSSGSGYWLTDAAGDVAPRGAVVSYGSLTGVKLNAPVVGIAATPDGAGYWLVTADGGIFSFGDAHFLGSTGNLRLNRRIVGLATTPDGRGYWLVAADGGIFSFGDARFFGSTGALHLNSPVVGMSTTPDGGGYWLTAADGGIFAFGDATFLGSEGGKKLVSPVTGIAASSAGGYRLVAADGGVFSFGGAPYFPAASGAA